MPQISVAIRFNFGLMEAWFRSSRSRRDPGHSPRFTTACLTHVCAQSQILALPEPRGEGVPAAFCRRASVGGGSSEMMNSEIKQLKQLDKAATPPPWVLEPAYGLADMRVGPTIYHRASPDHHGL